MFRIMKANGSHYDNRKAIIYDKPYEYKRKNLTNLPKAICFSYYSYLTIYEDVLGLLPDELP